MKTNFASKKESGFTFVNGTAMTVKTDLIRTAEPFKSLFPIRKDVLDRITADMKRYGFDNAHPIILWAGHKLTVVDGHTRLLVARKLGINMIPVVVREFENEAKALEYAINSQRNRRNLTDAELMRCITALDKRGKAGRPRIGEPGGRSAARTGAILGISRVKVEKIRSLLDHAPEEIRDAVRSGNLTINRAYVITMEKVKSDKCRNEDERRAMMAAELKTGLVKAVKSCIAEIKKKYPDFRLTEKEAKELMKEIRAIFKTELDKLTQKG
jgi:ParB family chromosome partitioning protein